MSYITVENLAFDKQSSHGVFIPNAGARYNVVHNCSFTHQNNHGVQDQGKYNEITYNDFADIGGIAVYAINAASNCNIHHNTFRRIGMRPENGIGQQVNLSAIKLVADSCHVHHNDIDSTGYCGISADGRVHLVERNVIRNPMLWNNDGAGLHAWGIESHHSTFRNNFVSGGDGTLEGTDNSDFSTPAIYFDVSVHDNLVQANTVYDHQERGILQNAGNRNNTLLKNVVFGGQYLLDLNGGPSADSVPQAGFQIKENILFALDDQAYLIRQVDFTNAFNIGTMAGNYYFQPYNANRYALRYVGSTPTSYTFADWQATGNDLTSHSSFVSWPTTQHDARLLMNPTDDTVSVNLLDSLYLDLDSALVCGHITLLPYTSKVLINTMTLCNPIGMGESVVGQVSLFPNPAGDATTLRVSPAWVGSRYQLYNALGQPIANGRLTSTTQDIDLSGLSRGMYLLDLQGRSRVVLRLVRE